MAGGHGSQNADGKGSEVDRIAPAAAARPLHRLGEARRREEISQRTVARCLGIGVAEVKLQEQKTADLPLSICCTSGKRF